MVLSMTSCLPIRRNAGVYDASILEYFPVGDLKF
jgi:hypothetical protein